MIFLVYFLIVACAGTQSATTKLYNRQAKNPAIFNAIKNCVCTIISHSPPAYLRLYF